MSLSRSCNYSLQVKGVWSYHKKISSHLFLLYLHLCYFMHPHHRFCGPTKRGVKIRYYIEVNLHTIIRWNLDLSFITSLLFLRMTSPTNTSLSFLRFSAFSLCCLINSAILPLVCWPLSSEVLCFEGDVVMSFTSVVSLPAELGVRRHSLSLFEAWLC